MAGQLVISTSYHIHLLCKYSANKQNALDLEFINLDKFQDSRRVQGIRVISQII